MWLCNSWAKRSSEHRENRGISMQTNLDILISCGLIATTSTMSSGDVQV